MASKAGKWMGNSSAEWVCECRAYRTLVPVDLGPQEARSPMPETLTPAQNAWSLR